MALLSVEKKFCFIHINRTGGSTVRHVLMQNVEDMEYYNPAHSTIQYVFDRRPEIADYFKFTYVRNPYDLMVSLYHYLHTEMINPDHLYVKKLSFYEFIEWFRDEGMKREEGDDEPFYRTQTDSCMLNGKFGLDKIYKYETLCNDTATSSINSLFNHLEIDSPKHIPIIKQSHHRPITWNSQYDSRTYKLMNKVFEKDFKNFKYPMYEY